MSSINIQISFNPIVITIFPPLLSQTYNKVIDSQNGLFNQLHIIFLGHQMYPYQFQSNLNSCRRYHNLIDYITFIWQYLWQQFRVHLNQDMQSIQTKSNGFIKSEGYLTYILEYLSQTIFGTQLITHYPYLLLFQIQMQELQFICFSPRINKMNRIIFLPQRFHLFFIKLHVLTLIFANIFTFNLFLQCQMNFIVQIPLVAINLTINNLLIKNLSYSYNLIMRIFQLQFTDNLYQLLLFLIIDFITLFNGSH